MIKLLEVLNNTSDEKLTVYAIVIIILFVTAFNGTARIIKAFKHKS